MEYRAVCISRALGAGAEKTAELVASRLGFRLIDEEILSRAASRAGVEPELVVDVEQRRSLLARLLEDLGGVADVSAGIVGGLPPDTADSLSSAELRDLIRTSIEEAASEGSVVIVAHAASVALAERRDVLRVLVTASPETRRRHHAEQYGISESDAAKEIASSDAARADYLKRFYGIREEHPTLYDLVVNGDRFTPDAAAALIVAAGNAAH